MPRIPALDPQTANAQATALLDAVQKALGVTPNMMRTMAQSPAVLDGYLALSGALGKGALGYKLGEQIALAIAEENGCGYCAAAHSAIGAGAGLSQTDIDAARDGHAATPRAAAAVTFARTVAELRGHVSDAEFATARAAGLSDGEIGEVVAHVALNIFTNYFNTVAGTDVDFPAVRAPRARAVAPRLTTSVV